MNVYQILSLVGSLPLYFILIKKLIGKTADQNLATWLSWALLDGFASGSMYVQSGNWQLPALYSVSSMTISCLIWRTSEIKWTRWEVYSLLFVIICIVMWWKMGPAYATFFSTLGVSVATIPMLKDAYLSPSSTPIGVYSGFIIVNLLSTIGGQDWTVKNRLYPAVCTILCVLIVGTAYFSKRFLIKPRSV